MTQLPIPIPSGFNISVKAGQKVSQGEELASSSVQDSSADILVHIASDLGVKPKEAEKFLTKKPGERIEAGDLIAKKSGLTGSREIRSKVSGTIASLDQEAGTISIVTDDGTGEDKKVITSPVDGEVESCDNYKVVLKTDKEALLAEASSGENGFAEVLVSDEDQPQSSDIDEKVSGKVFIAKKLTSEVLAKAIGLSAIGIIAQEISDDALENLRNKKVKTPVLRVSQENFKKIAKKNQKLMLDSSNLLIVKL